MARDYVSRMDSAADAALLRHAGLGEACVRTMRIGTLLLERGVLHGLSLAQIAALMCEPAEEVTLTLTRSPTPNPSPSAKPDLIQP